MCAVERYLVPCQYQLAYYTYNLYKYITSFFFFLILAAAFENMLLSPLACRHQQRENSKTEYIVYYFFFVSWYIRSLYQQHLLLATGTIINFRISYTRLILAAYILCLLTCFPLICNNPNHVRSSLLCCYRGYVFLIAQERFQASPYFWHLSTAFQEISTMFDSYVFPSLFPVL